MGKVTILVTIDESLATILDDTIMCGNSWLKEHNSGGKLNNKERAAYAIWIEAYNNPLPACCKECKLWVPNERVKLQAAHSQKEWLFWGMPKDWGACKLVSTLHQGTTRHIVGGHEWEYFGTAPTHLCSAGILKED